jgi:Bifunctional DNA primase/polymerase, N-terminal
MTDQQQVWNWWANNRSANIGLRTGVSFDVVDVDGEAAVDELEKTRDGGSGFAARW